MDRPYIEDLSLLLDERLLMSCLNLSTCALSTEIDRLILSACCLI